MEIKLYVLTIDGYTEGYGCQIFLVGVFNSIEKAKDAQNNLDEEIRKQSSIDVINLNEVAEITKDTQDDNYRTEYYLGGYLE